MYKKAQTDSHTQVDSKLYSRTTSRREGGRKGEGGRGEHSSAKLSTAQQDMPCDFLLQIN